MNNLRAGFPPSLFLIRIIVLSYEARTDSQAIVCSATHCEQTIYEKDIAGGVLMYIAQAFLLAGSIFGLDYYVHRLTDRNATIHSKD